MPDTDYVKKIALKPVGEILADLQNYVVNSSENSNFARPDISIIVGANIIRGYFYKYENNKGEDLLLLNMIEKNSDSIGIQYFNINQRSKNGTSRKKRSGIIQKR